MQEHYPVASKVHRGHDNSGSDKGCPCGNKPAADYGARRLVRWTLRVLSWVRRVTPLKVRRWFNRRFNVDDTIIEQGAAFDLVRGSVNLVLAGALIALGTSLKLVSAGPFRESMRNPLASPPPLAI